MTMLDYYAVEDKVSYEYLIGSLKIPNNSVQAKIILRFEASDDKKLAGVLSVGVVNLIRTNPALVEFILQGSDKNVAGNGGDTPNKDGGA